MTMMSDIKDDSTEPVLSLDFTRSFSSLIERAREKLEELRLEAADSPTMMSNEDSKNKTIDTANAIAAAFSEGRVGLGSLSVPLLDEIDPTLLPNKSIDNKWRFKARKPEGILSEGTDLTSMYNILSADSTKYIATNSSRAEEVAAEFDSKTENSTVELPCPRCLGAGIIETMIGYEDPAGFRSVVRTVFNPCTDCEGEGFMSFTRSAFTTEGINERLVDTVKQLGSKYKYLVRSLVQIRNKLDSKLPDQSEKCTPEEKERRRLIQLPEEIG